MISNFNLSTTNKSNNTKLKESVVSFSFFLHYLKLIQCDFCCFEETNNSVELFTASSPNFFSTFLSKKKTLL